MNAIDADAAKGLADAFASFIGGHAGTYEVKSNNVKYALRSQTTIRVNRPPEVRMTFEVQCRDEDKTYYKSLEVKDVDSITAGDMLIVISGHMNISIAFEEVEPEPEPEPVPVPLPVQERNHLGPMAPLNIYNAHPRLFR